MTTYTEVLPETRSGPVAIDWTPDPGRPRCGTLTVKQRRGHTTYAVSPLRSDEPGVALRLVKTAGGSDRDNPEYAVFVSTADGRRDCPNCKGFHATGCCKHLMAVCALMANRWL